MPQISEKWQSMSKEEKIAATDSSLQDLKDQKEMRALSLQNVPINAFHDVRSNLTAIKSEVSIWYSLYAAVTNHLHTTAQFTSCSHWH
jgi:hypothetical protein